jgi:hypothetical protein
MVSLIAAKAYFFCLDTKETINQVSRNASLPHRAIALQTRQNLGCCLFMLLSLALALASVKSRYALPLRTRPTSFCLISSEAVLLTEERKKPHRVINDNKKASALTTSAGQRRRECWFSFLCDVRYEVSNSEKA